MPTVMPSNIATHRVCVAPMMKHTDRHFRYLIRLMSRHARLYTEMVPAGAIVHGHGVLDFDVAEHPLALQVGGSDPRILATCARIAEDWGYDEINLNVGCPSERVQSGRFGACLMAEPQRVAECVSAMREASGLPVTVKTRIGFDDHDSYEQLVRFVSLVVDARCSVLIIHARKAWLKGLSPKQNREVPPLRYDIAFRIKCDFPNLPVVVNGGIQTSQAIRTHLTAFDGVMVGRQACINPYLFATVDQQFFNIEASVLTRDEVLEAFIPYVVARVREGVPLRCLTRHLLGLFQGRPGARRWRRQLCEPDTAPGTTVDVLQAALIGLRSAA